MSNTEQDGIQLVNCSDRGEGIFTTKAFLRDDIVMVGVIEKELQANHSHASQIGKDRYVFHAGLISKVNHSCTPNCGIHVNASGAHDFIAMKTIGANEEVTFDYAMRNYGVDHFPAVCACGAAACRGCITGWQDLPEAKKQEYGAYAAPYLLALDALSEPVV